MTTMNAVGLVLEPVRCPRCGAEASRRLLSGRDWLYGIPGEFYVAECTGCALWFQNPRPTLDTLPAAYPSAYSPHVPAQAAAASSSKLPSVVQALRALRSRLARLNPVPRFMEARAQRASLTPQLVPHGRILEIGCAAGHRLTELRGQGWTSIVGIEMVPTAAERARALGFDIRCARVEEALDVIPDRSLDAVVSSMVLEHLYDPFAVLGKVAHKLKPGGQLLFSTVVRDAVDARLYGRYWAGFDFPRHMVHFRRQDLLTALNRHFEQVQYVCQAAPVDFVRSASWRRSEGEGTLLDRLFVAMGNGSAAQALSLLLARLDLTTRVSFSARRRYADAP